MFASPPPVGSCHVIGQSKVLGGNWQDQIAKKMGGKIHVSELVKLSKWFK